MGITAKWFNEELSAIHHLYEGRWTWEDLYAVIDETFEMLETVDHQVDFVIDVREASLLPPGASSQIGRVQIVFDHPKAGKKPIIVGASRLVRIFVEIFAKVSPNLKLAFRYVSTLEEARSLVAVEHEASG